MLGKLKDLFTKDIQLNRPTANTQPLTSTTQVRDSAYSESNYNRYLVKYTKDNRPLSSEYTLRKTETFDPKRFLLSIGEDPSSKSSPVTIDSFKLVSNK